MWTPGAGHSGCRWRISDGDLHPDNIITHRVKLEDAPQMYDIFEKKEDGCVKVAMTP